jgi:hypothetical protein
MQIRCKKIQCKNAQCQVNDLGSIINHKKNFRFINLKGMFKNNPKVYIKYC